MKTEPPRLERNGNGTLAPYQSFPQPAMAAPAGGAAVFVTFDVLKALWLPGSLLDILSGALDNGPLRDK